MTKFLLLLTSLHVTTFFSQTTNSSWIKGMKIMLTHLVAIILRVEDM